MSDTTTLLWPAMFYGWERDFFANFHLPWKTDVNRRILYCLSTLVNKINLCFLLLRNLTENIPFSCPSYSYWLHRIYWGFSFVIPNMFMPWKNWGGGNPKRTRRNTTANVFQLTWSHLNYLPSHLLRQLCPSAWKISGLTDFSSNFPKHC